MDNSKDIQISHHTHHEHSHSRNVSSSSVTKSSISLLSESETKFGRSASLWLFSPENKFRIFTQKIVSHKAFNLTITGIILVNSIFLALETADWFQIAGYYFNYIFTILFLIEFLLKIIAYGFVLDKNTYLRDPWNWLDFVVVVIGVISFLPQITTNLSALRLIRLLRPFKTITILPNMRRFLKAVINSLIDLSAAFLTMLFFALIFSVLGLSLWNDRYNYKCRTTLLPVNGSLTVDPLYKQTLCGGRNKCGGNEEYCLSYKQFKDSKKYFLSKVYEDIDSNERLSEFHYGLTHFKNIWSSFLVVFITTTGEGWAPIMYLLMDGHNYYISMFYFILCVIINHFFMLNLTVAVLLYNFERSVEIDLDIQKRRRAQNYMVKKRMKLNSKSFLQRFSEQSNTLKYRKRYQLIRRKEKDYFKDLREIIPFCQKVRNFKCFKKIYSREEYHLNHRFCYYCFLIYNQPFVQIFFYLCIFLNCILIALDRANMSDKEYKIVERLNLGLVCIFVVEILLQLIGLGFRQFIKNLLNVWDFLIILASMIELTVRYVKKQKRASIASVFRVLRILRVFKLFRSMYRFRILMTAIKQTIIRMADLFILFIIILYIYALLGYSLFADSLRFDKITGAFNVSSKSNKFNFDNFWNCLVSVFVIIIGDHWDTLFYETYRSEKANSVSVVIYFFTLVLIGQITLMNIFLAYLIDNFEKSCANLERNVLVRFQILGDFCELTKLHLCDSANKSNKEKDNAINVFNTYLAKLKRKKLVKEGKVILVSKSKIDFIKSTAKVKENLEELHKAKRSKAIKEMNFKRVFKNKETIEKNNEEIDHILCYNFTINYYKKPLFVHFMDPYEGHAGTLIGNEKITEIQIKRALDFNSSSSGEYTEEEDENEEYESEEGEDENKNLNSHEKEPESLSVKNNSFNLDDMKDKKIVTKTFETIHHNFKQDTHHSLSRKSFGLKKKATIHLGSQSRRSSHSHLSHHFIRTHTEVSIQEKLESLRSIKTKESFIFLEKPPCHKKFFSYIKNSSLFIFHRDSMIRKKVKKLVNRREFNYIIFALVLGNIVLLCFDNPWVKPNSVEENAIYFFNYFFNVVFIIEGLLRIIADDFLFRPKTEIQLSLKGNGTSIFEEILTEMKNPAIKQNFDQMSEKDKIQTIQYAIKQLNKETSYILNPINFIDFFCIVIGIVDLVGVLENVRYLRVLRAIRSVKPIRLLTKSVRLHILIKCLIKSLPEMANVFLICLIYLILASMFGVSLLKHDMNYFCNIDEYLPEDECVKQGGYWVHFEQNFSNFLYGLKSSFEIMLAENWENIMVFSGIKRNTSWIYIYFIVCVIIGYVFILKLVISVLIQTFKSTKKVTNNFEQLTVPERDWVKYQQKMMKYKPIKQYSINKNSPYKIKLNEILTSPIFEHTVTVLILLSTFSLMIQYDGASKWYTETMEICNYVFTLFFNIEITLKLIVHGGLYFKNPWNIFDCIIIILCDAMVVMNILSDFGIIIIHSLSTVPIIFRLFRVFRIFRLISTFKSLRNLVDTLIYMVPNVANVALILGIVLLIYANIGMNVFGTVPYREYINRDNNFRNFLSSVILLFQVSTGEEWIKMMNEVSYHNCKNKSSPEYADDFYCVNYNVTCYPEKEISYAAMNEGKFSCGNNFSYFYFMSFVLFCPVFLLNLCIVMVVDGFSESMLDNSSVITEEFMHDFINLWMDYDPKCKFLILPQEFVLILKELKPPFGWNYDRRIISNPLKQEKERLQYKIFTEFLNKQETTEGYDESLTEINFNDELFRNSYKNLPYAYQFTNFYLSKNKKVFTTDLEILHVMEKFELFSYEDKTGIQSDKFSYTFSNYLVNSAMTSSKNYIYVHFIDACIAISRYAVSLIHNIPIEQLRNSLVNSYTMRMWNEYFSLNEVVPIFNNYLSGDENSLMSNKLAPRVWKRVNLLYRKKMRGIRDKLRISTVVEEPFFQSRGSFLNEMSHT